MSMSNPNLFIFQPTSKNKAANSRDETTKESIVRKCANNSHIYKLEYTGKENINEVHINHFE